MTKAVKGRHGGTLNALEKGETANPNGRPRKFVSTVIKELAERGIEGVKPSQVVDLYERLMNCTTTELGTLANDENAGWEVRQTARYMLKFPDRAWNEIKDRAHGKAKQISEVTGKDGADLVPRPIIVASEDVKKDLEELLKNG